MEETLNLSLNVIGDSEKFPHKLLLAERQVSRPRKTFENNLSPNVKLSIFNYLRRYS